MQYLPFKQRRLLAALATVSVVGAAPTTQAANDGIESAERIVVTGSKIPRSNLVSASAVTVIDSSAIEASSYQNVGDILQTLAVSQPTSNSLSGNGNGATRFDLRGIGTHRTLILLNGRRLPGGGTGADSSPDLSAIPTALIERVEVLMDGASAIYGSDAIAGVVNIITKKNFDGVEINASYGNTIDHLGAQKNIELLSGISSERGSISFAATYNQQDGINSSEVPFSATVDRLEDDGSVSPWGSYWLPWTAFTDPETGTRLTQGPEYGDFRPFTNADRYNYHDQRYLQQPSERYTFSTLGNYELGNVLASEDVVFEAEMMYSSRKNDSNAAAQPLIPYIGGYDDIPISKDNYYNQQFGPKDSNGDPYDIFIWSKRMKEMGPRESEFSNQQYRLALALSGNFNDSWGWEAAFNFGRNDSKEKRGGVFNWARVRDAVGPSHFNDAGELRCGAGPDPITFTTSTCIPLNVFVQPGESIDPGAIAYVSGDWDNLSFGYSQVRTLTFDVAGSAYELPAGEVGLAAGLSHMAIEGRTQTDSNAVHATTTDGKGRSTGGGYHVSEAYIELNIPLLFDSPIADSLELNIASRFSDYSTSGDTTNSKVSLLWQVNDQLMVRSTASQAFRAANVNELFAGQLPSFATGSDPCATADNGPLRALDPVADSGCLATGAPAGGFRDTLELVRTNAGGNPELDPETARIFTAGFAISPNWLEGFTATFDYYDIKLEDTISTFDPIRKIELCNETGRFCNDIARFRSGPAQGTIIGVDNYNENLNASHYRGVDSEFAYALPDTEFGDFNFLASWHHGLKHEISIFDGGTTDYIGTLSANGGHQVKNKVNLAVNWSKDNWSGSWKTYYIGELEEDGRAADSTHQIDAWSYSSANLSYVPDNSNITYSIGVNNVFDQEPRRTMRTDGNTNSVGAYSPGFLGATYYLRTKLEF